MKKLFSALILILLAGPAHAGCQGSSYKFCSKNFHGAGTCSGVDVLATLQDSTGWPMSPFITPWEPTEITIVGITITHLSGAAIGYAFGGNSANADIMGWLGRGETHRATFYPAGLGLKFPAPQTNSPHLDLHVSCGGGGVFQMFYTIFYTVP